MQMKTTFQHQVQMKQVDSTIMFKADHLFNLCQNKVLFSEGEAAAEAAVPSDPLFLVNVNISWPK